MSDRTSNWIPSRRIRFAVTLASVPAVAAVAGSAWSPVALVLLVPALAVSWAAFLMLRIRRQLSPRGGGWERRIHELVVSRLALPRDSKMSAFDIGCGDASLLIALLEQAPGVNATGVDYWSANWDYAQAACEARLADRGLHATFRRMDAARLAFADASFDAVMSVMCFHEARAPRGAKMRGPLLAVSEALRVLKPGGVFVLIDRFADASDYGDPAGLDTILRATTDLRREPLVKTLGIPWPLKTKRALGPVDVISGRKIR